MTKRIIALTTMLLLLLASATGATGVKSMTAGNPPSVKEHPKLDKEQIKAEVLRAIEDARKNAIYDSAGRISKMTFVLPDLGKFTFEYKYDQQNRLQYMVDEKGRRTEYAYGESGELRSITLPNGKRMYELDKDGKGVFFKDGISFARCNAPQKQTGGTSGLSLRKVALMDDDEDFGDGCRAAVAVAVSATAVAAGICASGDAIGCVTSTVAAAALWYAAYDACRNGGGGVAPVM